MVAVAGGMYMEHRKIRTTKVSTIHRCRVSPGRQDIDLFLQLNGNITHMELRDKILQLNKANLQKKCGVTYRDPESRAIIPIDLVNGLLLSSCYIAHRVRKYLMAPFSPSSRTLTSRTPQATRS